MATQTRITGLGRNTRIDAENGVMRVVLHGTPVVTVCPDGTVTLNSGGWRTVTTKTRMNQASREWDLGYYVYQQSGKWFIWFRQLNGGYGGDVPFIDGYSFPATKRQEV